MRYSDDKMVGTWEVAIATGKKKLKAAVGGQLSLQLHFGTELFGI